jgi:methylmalonyl-CoA mutase
MSAVMGGVNELNVLPYDGETINGASSLAERMAINISLILKEESYLHAVIDPTGGSYSIEDLTQKFSKSAWETFQFLDKQGGIFNENAQKWMREQVTSTGIKRIELIKNKEKTLIGVNKFLNPQAENNSFGDYGTYFGLNKINFERDI